jgi:hypothetical protein
MMARVLFRERGDAGYSCNQPTILVVQDMAIGRSSVADAGRALENFFDFLIRLSCTAVAPGLRTDSGKPKLGDFPFVTA